MANKYESLRQPQAVLDFHQVEGPKGPELDGQTVKRRTEDFVARARKRGLERIRIITGKGLHSRGKTLVGPQVRRTLDGLQRAGSIVSWTEARENEGGAGALDVRLVAAR